MNEDTIAGKLKSVGGKIEEKAGEVFGSEKTANAGAANQVKGATQETWGNTKDAAHDLTTPSTSTAHDTRGSITGAAEHAKDSISRGLDNLKQDLHHDDGISQVH